MRGRDRRVASGFGHERVDFAEKLYVAMRGGEPLELEKSAEVGRLIAKDPLVRLDDVLFVAEPLVFEEPRQLGYGDELELVFEPPREAPATSLHGERPVFWDLKVQLQRPGLDFDETYLVPVYPPSGEPESSAQAIPDEQVVPGLAEATA